MNQLDYKSFIQTMFNLISILWKCFPRWSKFHVPSWIPSSPPFPMRLPSVEEATEAGVTEVEGTAAEATEVVNLINFTLKSMLFVFYYFCICI